MDIIPSLGLHHDASGLIAVIYHIIRIKAHIRGVFCLWDDG